MILGVLLALDAGAKTVTVSVPNSASEMDLGRLSDAMREAGYAVISAQCTGSPAKCSVFLPDTSGASAADLAPFFARAKPVSQKRLSAAEELARLEAKIDDGTATPVDMRRAVKLILVLTGLSKGKTD